MNRTKQLMIFVIIIGVVIPMQAYIIRGEDRFDIAITQLLGHGIDKSKQAEEELVKIGRSTIPVLSASFDKTDVRGKMRILSVLNKMKIVESQKEILNILKKTCELSVSGETWGGIPEEEFLKKRSAFIMKEFGIMALPLLKEELKKARDEFKMRIIITTGLLGDKKYFDVILDFLQKESAPWIRELAAFALGEIGDKRAIPLLEKALQDEFYYELYKPDKGTDIVFRPGDPRGRLYPVRQAAYSALLQLGVKTLK